MKYFLSIAIGDLVSAAEENALLQATIQAGGELEDTQNVPLQLGDDEKSSSVFISANGDITHTRKSQAKKQSQNKGFCGESDCGCPTQSCCSDGDVDEVCPLFAGGRQWMPYYYKCLKQHCLDQRSLFCETTCEEILQTHTCDDDLSVLTQCGSVGEGKIKDACPRTCTCDCPTADPPTYGTCIIKGDPHISTFDFDGAKQLVGGNERANLEFFEYGDFWIVKSATLWVQGRYTQLEFAAAAEVAEGLKDDLTPQSSVSALAVKVPGSEHHLVVEPKLYGDITVDGQAIDIHEGGFTTDWLHYEFQPDVKFKGGVNCHMHLFTVHPQADHNTTIRIVRCEENLDVEIFMPQPDSVEGHCGNFNGDPSDDVPNDLADTTRVGSADLLFEPWDWTQDTACNAADYQKALRHCNKLRLELWTDDYTSVYDMDACVVDYCTNNGPVTIPRNSTGGLGSSNFAPKVWVRHTGRVDCITGDRKWHQIGEYNTDVDDSTDTNQRAQTWNTPWGMLTQHRATTSRMCKEKCEDFDEDSSKGPCKAFVFGIEDWGFLCKGFGDLSFVESNTVKNGYNRVLCANLGIQD